MSFRSGFISLALATALTLGTGAAQAALLFSEDFSDNSAGWSLGPEWEIGSATAGGNGTNSASPDPALDHTPTADNGVAGVNIGGDAAQVIHDYYYLVTPVIDAGSAVGTVMLEFWRWLNSDYPSFMHNVVDVFDGTNWVNLWNGPNASVVINELSWNLWQFDITAHANSALQVRWGFNIGSSGVYSIASWNLDDVAVTDEGSGVLPVPATMPLFAGALLALGVLRRRLR